MIKHIWGCAALVAAAVAAPAEAAWHVAKSRHFIIYSDDRPQELREFAENLERFDSAVRFVRGTEDPPVGDSLRLSIYVVRDSNALSNLIVGKRSSLAGIYMPRASGPVAFVPAKMSNSGMEASTVFFHEYAHHLMYQDLHVSYPAWSSEGFAEFFSTVKFPKKGTVQLGTAAAHRSYGLLYLGKPPIEELLGNSFRRKTSEDSEKLYSRGWLLTHYLTFEPSRKGQYGRYLTGIGRGMLPLDAARAAFGDLQALDRELDRYKTRSRLMTLNVTGQSVDANIGTIAIRPLRAGEAAIMPVRMRSDRGVDEKTAPGVAADARRIAASYPNDPFVQGVLAEAEYDAGNYAAAIAAADRVLAVDPRDMQALIYKGRALMAQAQASPERADWKEIRALFMAANAVDYEAPEPLWLYYRSFGAAGQAPTKNAVDGLAYALVLAPFDWSLRFETVAALVQSKRFKEAKAAAAAIAFNPHSGADGFVRGQQLIAAIDAGDVDEAMRLLSAAGERTEEDGA